MDDRKMILGLISSDNSLKKLLDAAASQINFNFEDSVSQQDFDLILVDFEGLPVDLKLNAPYFAILGKNQDFVESLAGDCIKTYQKPLRMGQIMDDIHYFSEQRRRKAILKPIQIGAFQLDPRHNILTHSQTRAEIKLTDKEQEILLYLYAQKGNRARREDLLNHVWNYVDGVETHTLETHIYRLRQKIETNPAVPDFLITEDDGYFLNI